MLTGHITAYPAGIDLSDALLNRGVTTAVAPPNITTLDGIMSAVVHSFERDTGWIPFLETNDTETVRTFTPSGTSNILFLNAGSIDPSEITYRTTVLTADEQYWLEPVNDTAATRIVFSFIPTGIQTLTIEGFWGYCTELEEDVAQAIINKGVAEYLRQIANSFVGIGGTVTEIKQDDVTKKFGEGSALIDQYEAEYTRVVSRYLAPWKVLAT
jgi:hypothetical protein